MRARVTFAIAACAAVAGLALSTTASAEQGRSDDAGIRAVRAFTERYRTGADTAADGFAPTNDCVPRMGYHYVNVSRVDTNLEPSRPEALLYRSTTGGARELVGAEWIVVDADQDLTTDGDRPSLFGHPFDGPMPGHGPGMPVHYDLHAYAWVANPAGAFTAWNPAINCA